MAGRGRGGRGGGSRTFSRDQLASVGIANKEAMPEPVTQPPSLYPPLNRQPVPLKSSEEIDYLVALRQDIIDHMQLSTAYIRVPDHQEDKAEKEIDKLIAQLPTAQVGSFNWELFPTELRPKMSAKRTKKLIKKEDVDVESRLNQLEKLEATGDVQVKEEVEDEEVDEDANAFNEVDEEMDDGTDYANNYFDNGEGCDDDDDNLDDDAVY